MKRISRDNRLYNTGAEVLLLSNRSFNSTSSLSKWISMPSIMDVESPRTKRSRISERRSGGPSQSKKVRQRLILAKLGWREPTTNGRLKTVTPIESSYSRALLAPLTKVKPSKRKVIPSISKSARWTQPITSRPRSIKEHPAVCKTTMKT